MKIATNTVFSFGVRENIRIFQPGDEISEISAIILMLPRNWGSSSIEQINSITYWISKYPMDIPCYLAGCETTIPDENIFYYRDDKRDLAIRELCNAVLSRSTSIGARGKITYKYLTEFLGYSSDQVDLIYEQGASSNLDRVSSFLKKNECHLEGLEGDILAYQANQHRWTNDRARNFDRTITISAPFITQLAAATRVSANVEIDGETKEIWCETDQQYGQYLLSERTDAFLTILLPLAMRTGRNIICSAPVTEHFLHNLREVLVPHLVNHDSRLHETQIHADGDATQLPCPGAVATGMSCGVDSFYTTALYKDSTLDSMRLTHLYCGNYLYGNSGPIYERAAGVADSLGLPLVRTATNINDAVPLPHLYTHFFKTLFGVLSLRKLFRYYYYSTAEDFSHFSLRSNGTRDTAEFELLLLYSFSCPDFQVMTGGAKSERLEKTKYIADFPVAQNFLNVCLYPNLNSNCGRCEKCSRTLLALDMLGQLDSFRSVFEIDKYRESRLETFTYLVRNRNSIFLREIYQFFSKAEPDLIALAENRDPKRG